MPKLQEFEKIKTVEDHYELIQGIMGCAQEILDEGDSKASTKVEKEFSTMIVLLTKSLKNKLKYVLKESRKYSKKPSLIERMRDFKEEQAERKEEREERKRLKDEDYRAYLEWRDAQEEQSESEEQEEQSESEEQEESSLPAVWEPRTPAEVFEGEQKEESKEDETEE